MPWLESSPLSPEVSCFSYRGLTPLAIIGGAVWRARN
jgi:hypothetical protein